MATFSTSGKLVQIITAKALGIVWRDSKNMADSSKPLQPVKDALKVIIAFFPLRSNYAPFLILVPAINTIHLYVLNRVKSVL